MGVEVTWDALSIPSRATRESYEGRLAVLKAQVKTQKAGTREPFANFEAFA